MTCPSSYYNGKKGADKKLSARKKYKMTFWKSNELQKNFVRWPKLSIKNTKGLKKKKNKKKKRFKIEFSFWDEWKFVLGTDRSGMNVWMMHNIIVLYAKRGIIKNALIKKYSNFCTGN